MSDQKASVLSRGATAVTDRTAELRSVLTPTGENRLTQWFFLTGSRTSVAVVLLGFVFLSLLGLALVRPIEVRTLLTETSAAQTLFSSLLSGAILLVSIVVSINSIVLSQEITDIENQQERIAASIEFRRHIEEYTKADVTPARPAEFLTTVLYATLRQTRALQELAAERSSDDFGTQVEELAAEIDTEVQTARRTLERARLGSFRVLLAGLNYDNSGQLHATRTLKRDFQAPLGDDEVEAIDDLLETLQHIATAREYFKSLYYKRELARLSSVLLSVSLPVIVFTSYVLLALGTGLLPEIHVLWASPLLVSFIFAYTVALAPFVVLAAYVLRASTVTLRTLAAGPFVLQTGAPGTSFEWEGPDASRDWELDDRPDDE